MSNGKVARMKRKLKTVEEQLLCCEAVDFDDLVRRRQLLRQHISRNVSEICAEQLALPHDELVAAKYGTSDVLTPVMPGKKRATLWSNEVSDRHADCHARGPPIWKNTYYNSACRYKMWRP